MVVQSKVKLSPVICCRDYGLLKCVHVTLFPKCVHRSLSCFDNHVNCAAQLSRPEKIVLCYTFPPQQFNLNITLWRKYDQNIPLLKNVVHSVFYTVFPLHTKSFFHSKKMVILLRFILIYAANILNVNTVKKKDRKDKNTNSDSPQNCILSFVYLNWKVDLKEFDLRINLN